jgi:hypothetical protein
MGKAKFRPPSIVDSLTFPVFGLTWYGTPASPKNDGVSLTAYCGGGGSAKTGVGNKIVCDLIVQQSNNNYNNNAATDEVTGSTAATPPPSSTVEKRTIEISTGEALCFGIHAFRPHDDTLDMIRLVACVGDDILLYGIPIHCRSGESSEISSDDNNEGAILLAKTCVGKGYGANVATYTAMHNIQSNQLQHLIGVGCENGHVVILQMVQKTTIHNENSIELSKLTECTAGHTKAICAIQFHPRGQPHILSSAKDGSARVFHVQSGQEVGIMKCEVHDPNGPPPPSTASTPSSSTIKTKDPRMMKRPPQILVRGCAYGDLEGKTMYTIASGKRGPAYLTKWKTLVPLNNSSSSPGGPPPVGSSSGDQLLNIRQEYRIQCSPVPISATSLSSDGTILAMGSVEGSIILYNLETQSIMKQFNEVHDLPVTCIASRPIPNVLMLPGELEGGVNFDAVSASADNRMGRWTMQKKSRIKPVKKSGGTSRKRGPIETFVWQLVRIPLLIIVTLFILAIRDVLVVCREEFSFPAVLLDVGAAGHCLYREVLWADDSRPGVMFVPQ